MTATKAPHNPFTSEELNAAPANPFKVGDGATICGYTDRHAYTVIGVTRTTVKLQRDKATLLNGVNSGAPDALVVTAGGFAGHTEGNQRHSYEADPKGAIVTARVMNKLRRRSMPAGQWYTNDRGMFTEKLVPVVKSGSSMVVAGRHEHYDFNF